MPYPLGHWVTTRSGFSLPLLMWCNHRGHTRWVSISCRPTCDCRVRLRTHCCAAGTSSEPAPPPRFAVWWGLLILNDPWRCKAGESVRPASSEGFFLGGGTLDIDFVRLLLETWRTAPAVLCIRIHWPRAGRSSRLSQRSLFVSPSLNSLGFPSPFPHSFVLFISKHWFGNLLCAADSWQIPGWTGFSSPTKLIICPLSQRPLDYTPPHLPTYIKGKWTRFLNTN